MHGNRPRTMRDFMTATPAATAGVDAAMAVKASGEMTMRRLSEPLVRQPGDLDPTSNPGPMSIDAVIQALVAQAEELKAANAADAEASQNGEGDAMDAMMITSLLETNPRLVIEALVAYLNERKG
jgi:hypothetical protein